jgi:hypothetical protein
MNRLQIEQRASTSSAKREIERIGTRIKRRLNLMLDDEVEHQETRTEASEALRGPSTPSFLTLDQVELQIELKGNLAAMLGAAQMRRGR